METPTKLVIFGAGRIGAAIARRLLDAGFPPDDLVVTTRDGRPTERTEGLRTAPSEEAAPLADVAMLCAKPQDTPALVEEIGPSLGDDTLVVSFASGLTTSWFESRLGRELPVIRVMTNLAIEVGKGTTVLSNGRHVTESRSRQLVDLLEPTGAVLTAPEDYLDVVSAVSGGGLAYVYFLVEAMTQAGVSAGLPSDLARELLVQAVIGAGELMRTSGRHPVQLREDVLSRGGQTVAGFREVERHNVRTALFDAVHAARDRGIELGAELQASVE